LRSRFQKKNSCNIVRYRWIYTKCNSNIYSTYKINIVERFINLWDFRFSWRRVWSIESSGMYCFVVESSSPWWWRQYAPLKRRSTSTWLHGTASQKTKYFYKFVCYIIIKRKVFRNLRFKYALKRKFFEKCLFFC
jgi:hypothetical protein